MIYSEERKQLLDQIKELQSEKKAIYACALRWASRVINEDSSLTVVQKSDILDRIWSME
ncbi:hypothetical protein D3C78_1571840 [compost metagenome]